MSEERKFDEAAFDKAVAKPNGWSGVADPVAEIRKMRDGDEAFGKDVLRTALSLVRAHFDGADDVFLEKSRELAARLDKEGCGDLASFVRAQTGDEPSWVPMERKPRVAPGNAAAMRAALEECRDYLYDVLRDAFHDAQVAEQSGNPSLAGYEREQKLHKVVEAALAAPTEPPSNAAAIREAMHQLSENLFNRIAGVCPNLTDEGMLLLAEKALAAPARNCDKFSTAEGAYAAWQKHNSLTAICDWLFDKAKGKETDNG